MFHSNRRSKLTTSVRRPMLILAVAGICLMSVTPAGAGSIEQARKLLADGRHEKVDEALGELLSVRAPSAEALRVSLDAARAGGRVITAQRRVTALLSVTQNKDAEMVYLGAQVSELAGERRLAVSRYLAYTQMQSAPSEKLRHALAYLSANGKFPVEYKKYVATYGATPHAWSTGLSLLARLIADAETPAAVDIAAFMLTEAKPTPAQVSTVHRMLAEAARGGQFGDDPRRRYVMPLTAMLKARGSEPQWLDNMASWAYQALTPGEAVDVIVQAHRLSDGPAGENFLRLFGRVTQVASEAERIALGENLLKTLGPVYQKSDGSASYALFIRYVTQYNSAFLVRDRSLFTEQDLAGMIDTLRAKGATDKTIGWSIEQILGRLCSWDIPLRTRLARRYAELLPTGQAMMLVGPLDANPEQRAKQIIEAKPAIERFRKGRPFGARVAADAVLMEWFNKAGDKDALTVAARNFMQAFPLHFDYRSIHNHLIASGLLSPAEKIDLLAKQYAFSGPSQPLDDLIITSMARDPKWHKDLGFKKLQADYRRRRQPEDPVIRTLAKMAELSRTWNRNKEKAKVLAQFIKGLDRPFPASRDLCNNIDDLKLQGVIDMIFMNTHRANEVVGKAPILDYMTPGENLQRIWNSTRQTLTPDTAIKLAAQLKGNDPTSKQVWLRLAELKNRPKSTASVLAPFYSRMGWNLAVRHLMCQVGYWHGTAWHAGNEVWDGKTFVAELDKAFATNGFQITDPIVRGQFLHMFAYSADRVLRGATMPARLTDKVLGHFAAEVKAGGDAEVNVLAAAYQMYARSGDPQRAPAFISEQIKRIAAQSPDRQVQTLGSLMRTVGHDSLRREKGQGPYTQMFGAIAAAYAKLSDAQWRTLGVAADPMQSAEAAAHDERWRRELTGQPRVLALGEKLSALFRAKIVAGVPSDSDAHQTPNIFAAAIAESVEKRDWPSVIDQTASLATMFRVAGMAERHRSVIHTVHGLLDKAGVSEINYAFLRQIEQRGQLTEALGNDVALLRAQAASKVPGLIPVDPGDKTYALHQAAQALMLGNEIRAWELSREKLDLLRANWQSLDPNFVVWCAEQLRKQKSYDDAGSLATEMLAMRATLEPAIAASALLTLADTLRGQQEYDEALKRYQELTRSIRYTETPAGLRAREHMIGLLIVTAAYDQAEEILQRMVRTPDLQVQADAYYLLARVAAAREEYDHADKYLAQVRTRVPDHIEAAFLEGNLRTKTPGALARGAELEVGSAKMKTIAAPGRELILKLQDPNLAIAQGAKAIPIIIETSDGKDAEQLELLPNPAGKNLFTGTIYTVIGKVVPGNNKLELRGGDTVSYRIAPKFQTDHDINYPPKLLAVKADGMLAASAGRILTEEEAEQDALKRRMAALRGEVGPAWSFGRGSTVRPGSPVYLQVTDLDRDLTDKPDTVTVHLTTSSGDSLPMTLTETGEHTGIFEASAPTSIPLPKARASDTFEGSRASWMINSTQDGVWKSLADGQKPKWVEADTMSSHMVKTVTLKMPDVSILRGVSLTGRLGGDDVELASFPLVGQEHGLRVERFSDAAMKQPAGEAATPQLYIHNPNPKSPRRILGDAKAARLTGFLAAPVTGEYKFRLQSRGIVRLWLGKQPVIEAILTEKAQKRRSSTLTEWTVKLEAGVEYPLKVEYVIDPARVDLRLEWGCAAAKIAPNTPVPSSALYPGTVAARRDDLTVTTRDLGNNEPPGDSLRNIQKELHRVQGESVYGKSTSTPMGNWWHVGRLSGTFFLTEAKTLKMRLAMALTEKRRDRRYQARVYLLIDGRPIYGSTVLGEPVDLRPVALKAGPHKLEMYWRGWAYNGRRGSLDILHQTDKGDYAPLPAEWFSVDHTPGLAPHVLPKGRITIDKQANLITATLAEPRRLRSVRWDFPNFTGNDVAVEKITVTDVAGKQVIPVEQDFSAGTTNDTLEIAPGDRIRAVYLDERYIHGQTPERAANLNAAYMNGAVWLANSVPPPAESNNKESKLLVAERCASGDELVIIVREADNDLTPERDITKVTVTTAAGEKLVIDALETQAFDRNRKPFPGSHTGVFEARLKLGKTTGKGTIKIIPGDQISVSYLDRENTKPGIPIERTNSLTEGGEGFGGITVLRTRIERFEDESETGKMMAARLRRISEDPDIVVYAEKATHVEPRFFEAGGVDSSVDADGLPICSVRGSLRFRLLYPRLARNAGSATSIAAVAESELRLAKAQNRRPLGTVVPMEISGGYGLAEGVFGGEVLLQLGKPGDALDLSGGRLNAETGEVVVPPTIVVTGSDVVQLRFTDPTTKKTSVTRIRLLADARLEVLERTWRAQKLNLHLGESYYVRVTDPDQNTTDKRDVVRVAVSNSSGGKAELLLTETFEHSGVFTGTLSPRWIKDKPADDARRKAAVAAASQPTSAPAAPKAPTKPKARPTPPSPFYVEFGDTVTFAYADLQAVSTRKPLALSVTGKVLHGADGSVALFTKRYKDPEIAVRTSFLTAESLFEMAKHFRTLKRDDDARKKIAEGKAILQRALRDYPRTKLMDQGRFLVALLDQELGNHTEAIGRYSEVIQRTPRSAYAPKALYNIAQCYEALANDDQSCEELVRVTYLYPESPEVAKASLRLGRYYYRKKVYDVAGRVFQKFYENNRTHRLAPNALFLAGQCFMISANSVAGEDKAVSARAVELYASAVALFGKTMAEFPDDAKVRSEAMYWLAICSRKAGDYPTAYQTLKQLTWDYPESEKAKIAQALLETPDWHAVGGVEPE